MGRAFGVSRCAREQPGVVRYRMYGVEFVALRHEPRLDDVDRQGSAVQTLLRYTALASAVRQLIARRLAIAYAHSIDDGCP